MSQSMFKKAQLLTSIICAFGISSNAIANDKVSVVTSFSVLSDLVDQVGGEHIDITTLVKINSDAHVYSPTPKDALSVKNAKLLVMNGLDFEGWMPRFLESAQFSGTKVIASEGIKVIAIGEEDLHGEHQEHANKYDDHDEHQEHANKHDDHDEHDHDEHDHEEHASKHDDHDEHQEHANKHDDHDEHEHEEHASKHDDHDEHDAHQEHASAHAGHDHGAIDPHAWHSIDNVIIYVQNIEKGLSKVDPKNSKDYKNNALVYIKQLEQLKIELQTQINTIPLEQRKVITPHDAFAYLSRDFKITFIAPQGTSTESEPSASDMAIIIKQIRKDKIAAVFMENITDNRIIEQISRETEAHIGGELFSDALSETKGPAASYLAMMQHNVMTIVKALAH